VIVKRTALVAAALIVIVAACRPETRVAPGLLATWVFEPSLGFFGTPFPSDARRTPTGAPDFSGLPNPGGVGFVDKSIESANERDGFDPTGAVYLRFDRELPLPRERPLTTTADVPGVWLVDIDPDSTSYGRRVPAWVRGSDHHDGVRPAHLLQVLPVPGIGMQEGTTYAVLVERDIDHDGAVDFGTSRRLQALLSEPGDASDRWYAAMAPLRAALGDLKLGPSQLAAATVYTTGRPTSELFDWVASAMKAPAPELVGELMREREHDDYVVLRGVMKMPMYQDGTPPHFFSGGRLILDENHAPVVQGYENALFYLSIPKGDVPEEGLPHYFYVHGTGGKATQAIDRGFREGPDDIPAPGSGVASWVAPLGYSTSCMAGTYSPDRIGWRALDGYAAYMFFNPVAMRDNFRQMILEQVHFLRLLEDLAIDPKLVPEARVLSDDGQIRFSKTKRVVGGQSLGSYLSGMIASVTGAFDGAILTGAGGSWIEFGFGPKDPVDLTALLDIVAMPRGEELDRHHPFITAFQNAVGPADNTLYTPYVLRRPRAGARVPHVLVIEGQRDLQVPINLQRALVLSVGADLVGRDVGKTTAEQLTPILPFGDLRHVPEGLKGNRRAPDGSPRTAVVTRHMEDGRLEGHYVLFQRPEAQDQLKSFLQALLDEEVPFIR
jgi:hypothetical protein